MNDKDVLKIDLEIGKFYHWRNQKERLIFLGCNFSGNGPWYQFALIESPDEIWCECLTQDLAGIEPTSSNLTGEKNAS